jgi:hypothetical protein
MEELDGQEENDETTALSALRGSVAKRWYQLEDFECANEVMAIADKLESQTQHVKSKALEAVRGYHGIELSGLEPTAYLKSDPNKEIFYPLHNSGVETLVSQIGGRQKPKPQFQTRGAEWRVRRRARKADKFIEAILQQPQGPYQNAWELTEDALLRDGFITGNGTIFVGHCESKVTYERVPDYEVLVDSAEAEHGDPKTIMWAKAYDEDKLIADFVDGEEDEEEAEKNLRAILAAKDVSSLELGRRVVRQVRVVQAWRLPLSKKQPGRHVICVQGRVLYSRKWERKRFPFVRFVASRLRGCLWRGQGIVELGEAMVREVNEGAVRMQEKVKLSANKRTYYRPGSLNEEDLQANDAEVLVPVQEGHEYPSETLVPPFTEAERSWNEGNVSKYYDFMGIQQSAATGRKEPGVNAAVAMRTLNDLGSLRQAPRARRYEYAYVELARCTLDALEDIAASGDGKVVVHRVGKRTVEEIDYSEIKMDELEFELTIAPASSLPNDPAGRLSMVQELFNAGAISLPTFRNLLGWPDLDAEMNSETSEYEYLEQLAERYLDAEEATWDEGDYESPLGFIVDKQRALLQFSAHYFQAKIDKAPAFNLELLETYIKELDAMIAASMAPPEGMAPPGAPMGGPPGMPPGAPPMAASGEPCRLSKTHPTR